MRQTFSALQEAVLPTYPLVSSGPLVGQLSHTAIMLRLQYWDPNALRVTLYRKFSVSASLTQAESTLCCDVNFGEVPQTLLYFLQLLKCILFRL